MACVLWSLPTFVTTFPSFCASLSLLLLAFSSLNIPYLSPQGLCTRYYSFCLKSPSASSVHGRLLVVNQVSAQPAPLKKAFPYHISLICSPSPCHVLSNYSFVSGIIYLLVFDRSTSLEYKFHVIFLFISVFPVSRTVSGT